MTTTSVELTRCDRCHQVVDPDDVAKGWPVPVQRRGATEWEDTEYICADCHGGAHCEAGHTLRGDTESRDCAECLAQRATDLMGELGSRVTDADRSGIRTVVELALAEDPSVSVERIREILDEAEEEWVSERAHDAATR